MRSPTVADRSERGVPTPEGWATPEAITKAQDATHVGNHGEEARLRAASASRSYDVWTSNPDSVMPSGGSDDGLLVAEDGSDHPSEAHQSGHGGEGETWSLANRLGVEAPSMLRQRRI